MTATDKLHDRLAKLRACRDGEAALGNTAAAEAFAAKLNQILMDHELNEEQIHIPDTDEIIEVLFDGTAYGIPRTRQRIGWQESLARIVAKAHLCKFLVRSGSNLIWFVGTKTHTTVAEYAYGTLVPAAEKIADYEYYEYRKLCRREKRGSDCQGYRAAWLTAFVQRIAERFEEIRRASIAAEVTGTAMVRLDQALVRAQEFVNKKYSTSIQSLGPSRNYHAEGRAAGRAAADRMALGRKGVTGHTASKLLR